MTAAEITAHALKLDESGRVEVLNSLLDSLDGEDEVEDSITIALRRSVEMKSGEDPGMTLEELMAGVQAGRIRK